MVETMRPFVFACMTSAARQTRSLQFSGIVFSLSVASRDSPSLCGLKGANAGAGVSMSTLCDGADA